MPKTPTRCSWPRTPLDIAYHDQEWGVPVHDDRRLFEFLTLEGAQAGLSWSTILKKRDNYRRAFARFDPAKVARFDKRKLASLLRDEGIVRHRGKIESVVTNARAVREVQKELGSFDAYIWRFTKPEDMSRDLKRRGFRFVGPTTCYAFMQAAGLVNDHATTCFRYAQLGGRRA